LDVEIAPGAFDSASELVSGLLQDEDLAVGVAVRLFDRGNPDAGEVGGEDGGSQEKYEEQMFHADKDTALKSFRISRLRKTDREASGSRRRSRWTW
jgi:hypothetical protein